MIGFLRGWPKATGEDMITLCVGDTGYEIHCFSALKEGEIAQHELWIHEHAPQDAPHELYGFREREQRDLFRRLLDIKGVGPKVAMRIVGSGWTPGKPMPVVRGVGPTIAERISEQFQ